MSGELTDAALVALKKIRGAAFFLPDGPYKNQIINAVDEVFILKKKKEQERKQIN